jgi:hypothetical protein
LEGQDSLFTFTSVKDLANVVALAIDYQGEWPLIGGINGLTLPTSKILELGVNIRGMCTSSLGMHRRGLLTG